MHKTSYHRKPNTWWRHQMETFSALLAICAWNSSASRSFDVFFDLCLNKQLRKQSWRCWFETLSRPLWRHCNESCGHLIQANLDMLTRITCGICMFVSYVNPLDEVNTTADDALAPDHDDVIKWKHFPRYWPIVRGIHRSPLKSPHKGQWRGALMFSLIYVWIE